MNRYDWTGESSRCTIEESMAGFAEQRSYARLENPNQAFMHFPAQQVAECTLFHIPLLRKDSVCQVRKYEVVDRTSQTKIHYTTRCSVSQWFKSFDTLFNPDQILVRKSRTLGHCFVEIYVSSEDRILG